MSADIVRPILRRIRTREEKSLFSRAKALADEDAELENSLTTEALCKQRAERLIVLFRQGKQRRSHGFFRRLVDFKEPKTVYYQENVVKAEGYYKQVPRKFGLDMMYEEGERTLPFEVEQESHDWTAFNIGWEVGARSMVTRARSGRKISESIDTHPPIWVWWVASLADGTDENRQVMYEVNSRTGEVFSYTDGERDDRVMSLGKQAGEHALYLMGKAIEFIES